MTPSGTVGPTFSGVLEDRWHPFGEYVNTLLTALRISDRMTSRAPLAWRSANGRDTMSTQEQRIAVFAKLTGTTPEALRDHTRRVQWEQNELQRAKNNGATDTALVALASRMVRER